MALSGGTVLITFRGDGATVAVTPNGGTVVNFSCALDKVARFVEAAVADDMRGAVITTSINQMLPKSKLNAAGLTHI